MAEYEFTLEHGLYFDDAEEALFDLLDDYEDRDEYDIEYDERKSTAFISNDDIEIEIELEEEEVTVWFEIHSRALAREARDIEAELDSDIRDYFGLGRPRRSRQRTGTRRRGGGRAVSRSERVEVVEVVESKRVTAAILAFFLGAFGVHKFYLGRTGWGLVYLLFCWSGIPAIAAFIEFIMYLVMDDEAFIEKYQMDD